MKLIKILVLLYASLWVKGDNLTSFVPKMTNPVKGEQYVIDYNKEKQIPVTIYYKIVDSLLGDYGRYSFHKQLYISTANQDSYAYSGYDKGHMFSSASSNSHTANYESFDMVNIVPQLPSFNRGIWKSTEIFERNNCYPDAYVICGVILTGKEDSINGVTVPKYFYKIIYNPTDNCMIGFILTQESKGNLQRYAVNVHFIETYTDIKFFEQLPPNKQFELKYQLNVDKWNW